MWDSWGGPVDWDLGWGEELSCWGIASAYTISLDLGGICTLPCFTEDCGCNCWNNFSLKLYLCLPGGASHLWEETALAMAKGPHLLDSSFPGKHNKVWAEGGSGVVTRKEYPGALAPLSNSRANLPLFPNALLALEGHRSPLVWCSSTSYWGGCCFWMFVQTHEKKLIELALMLPERFFSGFLVLLNFKNPLLLPQKKNFRKWEKWI